MGIGTSLGAYFETELDHHAGNETLDQNEYSDEGITHDDTPIPVANITNTPGEILEGLEGTRVFGSGYGVPGPTQMRRPANSNSKSSGHEEYGYDTFIDSSWKYLGERFEKGNQIIEGREKLMNKMRDSGLNDLETQKLKNLDKAHAEHFGGNYPD